MDIFGASGHAKVIADILLSNGIESFEVWDDDESKQKFLGRALCGNFEEFVEKSCKQYLMGIGDNTIRKKLVEQLNETTLVAVHTASVLSKSVKIGVGTVVMANASINADTVVGKHAIINTNASIDHDCNIGDYAHISPNAALAGGVTIGQGSQIGIGACIIQGVKVGKWCVIGAGTVVIRDVPDGCTFVGNPGRIIKKTTRLK